MSIGTSLRDVQNVHTQVNFEGGGLRIGFEGERRTPLGLVFYGRTAASLVAGTFRCAYTETSGLIGGLVETGYPADRLVPMIDAEMGTGLSLWNDKLRVTAGYSFSGWFNTVRTDHFIGAVQNNNFTDMSNMLTFDGLVGRVELQYLKSSTATGFAPGLLKQRKCRATRRAVRKDGPASLFLGRLTEPDSFPPTPTIRVFLSCPVRRS